MENSSSIQFITCSDTSFLIQLGNRISQDVHHKVMALYNAFKSHPIKGVLTLIPTYCTVMVVYDPMVTTPSRLQAHFSTLLEGLIHSPPRPCNKVVRIPVCYGGSYGPDLPQVARYCKLSTQEVITRHSAVDYPILMMGFSPGFPFLGNLDPKLHTPRLATLRTHIPAGSVGLADTQTGIYPMESPGDWQLVGRTPLKLFQSKNTEPFRYQVGDHLRFYPINPEEYLQIKNKEAQ